MNLDLGGAVALVELGVLTQLAELLLEQTEAVGVDVVGGVEDHAVAAAAALETLHVGGDVLQLAQLS